MATLTITIPNAMVTELTAMATDWLADRGFDTSGTATQKGQRYLAEHMKADLIAYRAEVARQTGDQNIQTAAQNKDTAVAAAVLTAQTDGAGITG